MKLHVLTLCLIPTASLAQTSEDYAALWRTMMSAFTCSFYTDLATGFSEDRTEGRRLFSLGYEAGRDFFEARNAGLIEDADLDGMLISDSPSVDFAIGRMFERATDAVREQLGTETWVNWEYAKQLEAARAAYEDANCDFVR